MTALLVVGMIIVFVLLDIVVMARRRRRGLVTSPGEQQPMREPALPYGLFLDAKHAWLRLAADGTLLVGIDDFLAEALGPVDAVRPAPVGSWIERGAPLFTLQVGQRQLRILAPAAGEVRSINDRVVGSPRTLTVDPYGLGWVVALWTRDHKEAIAPLHLGNGAVAFLRQEFQRLVEFLTQRSSPAGMLPIADGGLPHRGAAAALDPAGWEVFQQQFLRGDHEER